MADRRYEPPAFPYVCLQGYRAGGDLSNEFRFKVSRAGRRRLSQRAQRPWWAVSPEPAVRRAADRTSRAPL